MGKKDAKANQYGNSIVAALKGKTASVKSAEDLGVCAQYASEKTCCTKAIVQGLNVFSLNKLKQVKGSPSVMNRINAQLVKGLNKCAIQSGKTLPASLNDQFTYDADIAKCQTDLAAALTGLTRGAACAVCAGVDKLGDYVDSKGSIIISADSAEKYATAAGSALKCVQDAQDKVTTTIDTIYTNYVDSADSTKKAACEATKKKLTDAVTKGKPCGGDNKGSDECKNKAKNNINLYSDNSAVEDSTQGDSTLDTAASLRSLAHQMQRLLQTSDSTLSTGTGGVNAYVTTSADTNAATTGEITSDFSEFAALLQGLSFLTFVLLAF